MQNRRKFIQIAATTTAVAAFGGFPLDVFAKGSNDNKITILHTNDVHSRIEPFPMDGGRNAGLGGAARRASLIKKIRGGESQVLLLDAGDIFQGTPYFNFYNGELEYKLMNEMGYDAATIGNHDFDAGLEGLSTQLDIANFKMLNANYTLTDTILANKVEKYTTFQKGNIKVGVFGVGVELDGLVPKKLYGETIYNDPIKAANDTAALLTNELGCDLVICLSHLGFKYDGDKVSDMVLASQTENIDLIIGGHTHTFLEKPVEQKNRQGAKVLINQVGWAGINLGRIDYYFTRKKEKTAILSTPEIIR